MLGRAMGIPKLGEGEGEQLRKEVLSEERRLQKEHRETKQAESTEKAIRQRGKLSQKITEARQEMVNKLRIISLPHVIFRSATSLDFENLRLINLPILIYVTIKLALSKLEAVCQKQVLKTMEVRWVHSDCSVFWMLF